MSRAKPTAAEAREHEAVIFIRAMVKRGMSANAIDLALRGTDVGIRRADVLKYVRIIRLQELNAADVRRLDPLLPIPKEAVAIQPFEQGILKNRFRLDFVTTGYNKNTGRWEERTYSRSTDRLPTPKQAVEDMRDTIASRIDSPYIVSTVDLYNVVANPGEFD